MDLTAEALAAHQRAQLRSVGRTPEEHAALEQALARRRARKAAEAATANSEEQALARRQARKTAEAAERDSEEQARRRAEFWWAPILWAKNTAKAAQRDLEEERERHRALPRRAEFVGHPPREDPNPALKNAMAQLHELMVSGRRRCG